MHNKEICISLKPLTSSPFELTTNQCKTQQPAQRSTAHSTRPTHKLFNLAHIINARPPVDSKAKQALPTHKDAQSGKHHTPTMRLLLLAAAALLATTTGVGATAAPPRATITPAPHPLLRRAPSFTSHTITVPAYGPQFAYGPNNLFDPNAPKPQPGNQTTTWEIGGVPSYAQGVLPNIADNVVFADQANPKGVKTPGNLTLSFYGTGVKLYGYCKNDTQLNAWFDGSEYTGRFLCRDFSGSSNVIFATDSQPFQGHTLALGLYYSKLVIAYAEITTNVYSWG